MVQRIGVLVILTMLMAASVWADAERNKVQDKKYYENCQVYTNG